MESTRKHTLLGAGLVSSLTVALGLPALTWPSNTLDEMILLVYPLRMMDGDLPYRDFFTAYGPTHWWFLQAVFSTTAPTLTAARLVGLTIHVLLVLGVFRLARPDGVARATLSACTAALLLFRLGDAPYAWLSAAALCLWQVALLRDGRPTRGRAAVAGALAALAIGFRPDAALLALGPPLPLLTGNRRWRAWGLGLMFGALPLLVSVMLTPMGLVHDVLLGRAGAGAAQSRLPLLPDDPAQQALLALLVVAVLLAVVSATLVRRPVAVALALLAVLALPQALQRAEQMHFLYAALLSVPFLPQTIGDLLERVPLPRPSPRLLGSALAALSVLVCTADIVVRPVVETALGKGPEAVVVRNQGRTVPEVRRRAEVLEQLLPVLNGLSTRQTRLFVFDQNLRRPAITDVTLYYLLPQVSQTAYNLEVTPGLSASQGSRLVDDLETADLVVLLDVPSQVQQGLFPYEKDGDAAASAALARLFCQVAKVDFYAVYTRCQPPART